MSDWTITDPEGGVLALGTPAATGAELYEARRHLDAHLDHYGSIEGREAHDAFDEAINRYVALRELVLLSKFLEAWRSPP